MPARSTTPRSAAAGTARLAATPRATDSNGAANVPAAYLAVDLVHDAPPDDEEEDFDDDAPRTATLTAVGDAWAPRLAQLAPEDVG